MTNVHDRENLDPFNRTTDLRIWEALDKCHMKTEIESIGGLDIHVKESGASFSVGQRQLLCLARAILKSSKVYYFTIWTLLVLPCYFGCLISFYEQQNLYQILSFVLMNVSHLLNEVKVVTVLQILCLDECTANVDNQTASLLQNTISAECKGMTVLTIAHRISTVMKMDSILVLDQGKLVSATIKWSRRF